MATMDGLSPRVRGNRAQRIAGQRSPGSIPACAGEPRIPPAGQPTGGVYPRVCGGTLTSAGEGRQSLGLSPRVRGNPRPIRPPLTLWGSIPACAGEPSVRSLGPSRASVYPRVCGGTRNGEQPRLLPLGLSPRVRGNLFRRDPARLLRRSIPACAGEPTSPALFPILRTVYPRVCGGTRDDVRCLANECGLSPRVRGNLLQVMSTIAEGGSIPACAGEPCACRRWAALARVYPRVCGGTPSSTGSMLPGLGLSPRVRGNLRLPARPRPPSRSIPACAGEPAGGE